MRKKQSFHEFCSIIRGFNLFTKSGIKVEKYQAYWGMYKIEDLISEKILLNEVTEEKEYMLIVKGEGENQNIEIEDRSKPEPKKKGRKKKED